MKGNSTPQAVEVNQALKNLDMLVGHWDVDVSLPFDPSAVIHGQASFEWVEGGAFLLYRSQIDRAEFPRATAMIGPDDSAGTYSMLYFDSRGVSRIYEMSLNKGIWRLWRKFPGFSQRFEGRFSDDYNTITSRWEKSSDDADWEHDFDLTYQRVK